MSIRGSGVGGREAIVTLVACTLLGLECGWSVLLGFAALFQIGPPPYLLSGALGLLGTCVLVGLAAGRAFDRSSAHRSA
jgi:hypothetical protein